MQHDEWVMMLIADSTKATEIGDFSLPKAAVNE